MKVIFKYDVTDPVTTHHLSPLGDILHLGVQGDRILVWVLHEAAPKHKVPVKFFKIGTGQPFDEFDKDYYVGTVQLDGFVWHYFHKIT